MSLYDDDDTVTDKSAASGWASGIRLMHNQLAFKKASVTAPKRDSTRKKYEKLPPVIDLKTKKDEEENTPPFYFGAPQRDIGQIIPNESSDNEWKFEDEYDPFWPNEYDVVVKEMREKRDREEDEKRRQDREERSRQRRERFRENDDEPERGRSRRANNRGSGAAIAPPPSLNTDPDSDMPVPSKSFSGVGGSVAAKIMAKYGFREGQGLGKSKQGIVRALEVEKTSKRGGRIIKENELEFGVSSSADSPPPPAPSPPPFTMPPPMAPPPTFLTPPNPVPDEPKPEASISNVLKTPSKVLILLNMVGPGEVDDELEPEVREECSSKYGPVTKVVIFEIPQSHPEEAVRIFIEFQRVEAAVKALIDLNGRFFGGRQVKAGFYDFELFKSYKLNETVEF